MSEDRILEYVKKWYENQRAKQEEDAKRAAENEARIRTQRIIAEAEQEATHIIEEAQREAKRLIRTAQAEVAKTRSYRLLEEKGAFCKQVIDAALQHIAKLAEARDRNYVHFLERSIAQAAIELGGGHLVLYLNERDHGIHIELSKISEEVSKITKTETKIAKGRKTIDTVGGFVLKRADGSGDADYRLESLVEARREEIYRKILELTRRK